MWLNFTNKDRKQILCTLREDVSLLEKFNLMDYSLLLCIQKNSSYNYLSKIGTKKEYLKNLRSQFEKERTRNMFLSKNGKFIYYLGLIDYLQDYHFDKKVENFLKETLLLSGSTKKQIGEISAVPPYRYAPRFMQFMTSRVIIDQFETAKK